MKNKRLKLILGIVAAVIAVVAILFGFAAAFADTNGYPDSRGSLFKVMFGQGTTTGYQSIPALITAFVFFIVGASFCLFGAFLPSKIGALTLGIASLLLVVGGVMVFFTSSLWASANNVSVYSPVNGTGVFGMGISALVAAVIGAYAARVAWKQ